MPRNGSGTYSLPAGNPVVPDTTIDASWANDTMQDLANEITNSLSRTGAGGMLAPFRVADGSVSAPGLAFLNEANSGFYRAGSGEVWWAINGVAVLQLTQNGILLGASKNLVVGGNETVSGTLAVTGAITASAGVNVNNQKVTNLATPTVNADAANKVYVDDLVNPVIQYANYYLGPKSSDPLVNNSGGALTEGTTYWSTTLDQMRVYNGTNWVPMPTISSLVGQTFNGTGAQTAFTLANPTGNAINLEVFISGVRQVPTTDYSVSGTTLTFVAAPPSGTANIFVRYAQLGTITDGAGSIVYTPAGTGAVATTVQTKLREMVSVKDFGAVGDGVTDDTAAIQAAVDAITAAGGGVVSMPVGNYKVSTITLGNNVSLVGAGFGATTIIQTGSGTAVIAAVGSIGSSKLLTSNAVARNAAKTLAFDTTGIVADDWLLLADGYAYNSLDSAYKSGELVQVKTVDSGVQVTLYQEVSGSMYAGNAYETANGAYVKKVTFVKNLEVRNFTIQGDITTTTHLLQWVYAQNSRIDHVEFKNSGNAGAYLGTCQNCSVNDSIATDLLDDIAGGHSGYGVVLGGACDSIRVTTNSWSRCRHGFTTIGGVGYSHRVLVANNIAYNTSSHGIDTHASGYGILIDGNTVFDSVGFGISFRSTETVVSNNLIVRPISHGIAGSENYLSGARIAGNTILSPNGQGISVAPSCNNLQIVGNTIRDGGLDGITVFGSGTVATTGLVIERNVIVGFSRVSATRTGIITSGSFNTSGAIVRDNFVDALAGTAGRAIRLLSIVSSWCGGNKAQGTYSATVFDTGAVLASNNDIIDAGNYVRINSVAAGAAALIQAIGSDSNIDLKLQVKGTGVLQYGTLTASADVPITGYITIKDNGGTTRKLAVIA